MVHLIKVASADTRPFYRVKSGELLPYLPFDNWQSVLNQLAKTIRIFIKKGTKIVTA